MPELAEVAYYARRWMPLKGLAIRGQFLHPTSRVLRHNKTLSSNNLLGASIQHLHLHGKQILFELSGDHWIHAQLGMTGSLSTEPHTPSKPYERQPHDRLVIYLDGQAGVFNDARHFGQVTFIQSSSLPEFWAQLPPAVDHPIFTLPVTQAGLRRRPNTAIKSLLLDQSLFPGIGNWMADEILWRAAIHPGEASGSLPPATVEQLHAAIKEVAMDAMRVIAPNWGDAPDSWLFNHRWKDGGLCPRTGEALVRQKIGGRTACWSPAIQGHTARNPTPSQRRQQRG